MSCSPSRREFLTGLAALGLGAAACSSNELASPPPASNPGDQIPDSGNQGRINVHHHYGPPTWLKVLAEADALNVEPWKDWSPERSIEAMDAAGVRTAISSITVPGIYFWEGFGNQQAPPGATLKNDVVAMARDANDFGARMKTDHPGRFGIWASLPLPLVDQSLREIEYAIEEVEAILRGNMLRFMPHLKQYQATT